MTRERDHRRDAVTIYEAALAGVEPGRALARALEGLEETGPRVACLALGKAAGPMIREALRQLDQRHIPVSHALAVLPNEEPAFDPRVVVAVGDHPLPGERSLAAARAVAVFARGVTPPDEVWVLLSGGTSSLIAAPVDGVSDADFSALHEALHRAGLPIGELNRVRKRFARYGAGRLARALTTPRIRVFAISDVPGDDPAAIGSGPLEPDPTTARQVAEILGRAMPPNRLPASVRAELERVIAGLAPETPKPGDPIFRRRTMEIIASNQVALEHARRGAESLGYLTDFVALPLEREAADAGDFFGRLVSVLDADFPCCLLWGGETTVTLGDATGFGGRSQELALASAARIESAAADAVVLAAGTDGRDGPTDAAGAIVDRDTWAAITRAGIDPAGSLAAHDSYSALRAAGALIPARPTGTNVMDIVVGLRAPVQNGGRPGGRM
ncbi:MAG: DUF4147 domain-containing protein [Gemmatimonadota bacterium]